MENDNSSLLFNNESLWKKIFSSEIELGSNIGIYFTDFQTFIEKNFSDSELTDDFKHFMKHTIAALSNYSPENEQNQTTTAFLPEYFVFLTEQFIKYSDNDEIVNLIEPLFSPFSLTFGSFPSILSEISFILETICKSL